MKNVIVVTVLVNLGVEQRKFTTSFYSEVLPQSMG